MSVKRNVNTIVEKRDGTNQSTTWLQDDAAAASTNSCR